MNEWNIYDKVVWITTDAGGNMKLGADYLVGNGLAVLFISYTIQ